MQRTHIVAATGLVALAGAVSGAAINTTPLPRGIDAWEQVPRTELAAADLNRAAYRSDLPDHYPLITPQGRVEVAELRDHGLYRNRRFGMTAGWYEPAEEPAFRVVDADYRYVPDDFSHDAPAPRPSLRLGERAAAPDPAPVLVAAEAEPLGNAPPVELAVKPRVIDVAAELAARQ